VTIVMEPMVIRGRRPARARPPDQIVMEPLEVRARPLTNRAAGQLRDNPDRLAFGGFAYTRTAHEDAEVAAAVRDARRSAELPPSAPRPAPPPTSPDVQRLAFGGARYELTEQDRAEVAAEQQAKAEAARQAKMAASRKTAPARSAAGSTEEATAPPGSAAATPAVVAGVIPVEQAAGTTSAAKATPGPAPAPDAEPDQTSSVTTPTGIKTPSDLLSAARPAADNLPHPDLGRPPLDRALAPVILQRGTGRPQQARGGGGGGPPPRPVEAIEIDPVPKATEQLSLALNARLPDLELPALVPMPDGTLPILPTVKGVAEEEQAVEVDVEAPAKDAKKVNDTEAARSAAAANKQPDEVTEAAPKPLSPPVLVDFRRPPPPALPVADAAVQKNQVVRVLALIRADVDSRAQTLIDKLRTQAFPNVGNYFTDVTNSMRDSIRDGLQAKVGELQQAADITNDMLDAAVAARRTELEQKVTRTATAAELTVTDATKEATNQAEKELAEQERKKLKEQAKVVSRYRRALHSRDPTLVEELVRARLGYIDADVGSGRAAIKAAGDRREELIDLYETAYGDAYLAADDAWQHPAGRQPRAPPNTADGKLWYDVVSDALAASMEDLRSQTEDDVADAEIGLDDAGKSAKKAVRDWADRRLRRTLTDDEKAARTARDTTATEHAVTEALAAAERAKTLGELNTTIQFASSAYLQRTGDVEAAARTRMGKLEGDRLKQGQEFLKLGETSDPMAAVANYLVIGYERTNLTGTPKEIQDKIYAKNPEGMTLPQYLGDLGEVYFPEGAGGLEARVNKLWRAFEGAGTEEDKVYEALGGLDGHQAALLRATYQAMKGESLLGRIDEEMSGGEYKMAAGLAGADPALYAKGVIADSDGIFSNKPEKALDAIRNLPPGEAAKVVADPDTSKHLNNLLDTGVRLAGDRYVKDERGRQELNLLVEINATTPTQEQLKESGGRVPAATAARLHDLQAQADAIEFDRSVRKGTAGSGPDVSEQFERIRAQVAARAPPTWSSEQIDNEVRRRVRAMENAYEVRFGTELPKGGVSALRTAVAQYSKGTDLDLRTALLDVNRAQERATRLQRTTRGVYTSDSELNSELERTYKEALAEVRRDANRRKQVDERIQKLMEGDGYTETGRRPSARELAAYRDEAEQALARELGATWMAETGTAFAGKYGHHWGGGADALKKMIVSETQFGGEREALDRLANGGGLTDAQKVKHGVSGWGMESKLVLKGIANRTKKQLDRISQEYKDDPYNEGEDMKARLQSDTGGWADATAAKDMEREGFDVREALRGVPTTPDEEYAAAQRRFEYERDVYFGGDKGRHAAVAPEFASLQRQMDRVQARRDDYQAAQARGDTAALRRLEASISSARDSLNTSADDYRKAVDEHVEGIAQKVAIGVALAVVVVVAVATSILTAGAAAPAWVAVATAVGASIAGTAASMAVKQSMLGAAYSKTQFQTDLIVGAVDAIIAGLTAGLGDKLLKIPKVAGATKAARILAARAAAASKAAKPLIARAAAFSAEQVAQSVPTAVTGSLLNRDTWRLDPLKNVLTSAGMAAVTGVAVGGAMHVGMSGAGKLLGGAGEALRIARRGSGSEIAADEVVLGSTKRALASGQPPEGALDRGSWLEHWAAKREYLRAHPEANEFDFEFALAEGRLRAEADANALRRLNTDIVDNLVSGLSREDAELVRHARFQVVGDEEFAQLTASTSRGHAATINVKGEPVVILREGAPMSALREEGMHIAQFLDPKNVEKLALLEEGRLAMWADLSLKERIDAWQAKIDLEVDVQRRLIPQLEAELERPGLHPDRAREVAARLIDAESALDVLSRRGRALGELSAADVARMQRDDLPPSREIGFLEEPARLFAKQGEPKGAVPEELVVSPEDKPTSTLEVLPGGRVREVGSPYRYEGKRRRFVRLWGADSTLLEEFDEVFRRGRWRRSGRGNRPRGGIAEIAEVIEREPTLGQRGDTTRVTFDAKVDESGHGFDNVVLSFREVPGGTTSATVQVIEVKSAFERDVTKFGAIKSRFPEYLALLRRRLQGHLDGSLKGSGLSDAQLEAAIAAIDQGRLNVEIRVTEGTRVGQSTVEGIQTYLRKKYGDKVFVELDPVEIGPDALEAAKPYWDTLERYRLMRRFLGPEHPDVVLFEQISRSPRGVSPESIALADFLVSCRNARPQLVDPDVTWNPERTHIYDKQGAIRVSRPSEGNSMRDIAGDVVAKLRTEIDGKNPRVILDGRSLTDAQRREVYDLIRHLLYGDAGLLEKVVVVKLVKPRS